MSNCLLDTQTFQVGNRIRSTGSFTNAIDNYNPIDPSLVYVDVLDPNGVELTFQWATDPEVQKSDIGVYYIEHTLDVVGYWNFRWYSDGNVISSTERQIRAISAQTY